MNLHGNEYRGTTRGDARNKPRRCLTEFYSSEEILGHIQYLEELQSSEWSLARYGSPGIELEPKTGVEWTTYASSTNQVSPSFQSLDLSA
jgi:hypothetical protein